MKTQQNTKSNFKKGQSLNRRLMPIDVKYNVISVTWNSWNYEYTYVCDVTGPYGYKSKANVGESELYN